jgi:CRISPR-associated endonuclease/helicase Cas3
MVSDLKFKSHPDKPLEDHIYGVISKSRKYSTLPVVEVAALFHDLGKLNPNFQKKLEGITIKEYSRHSYLSVLAFFYYLKANENEVKSSLGANSNRDFSIKVLQTIALIAYHHGDIPNFNDLLNMDEVEIAANFAMKQELPFSDFLAKKLANKHNNFIINYVEKEFIGIGKYIAHKHAKLWQTDALNYFMDTQFTFAALINADKRDAGKNEYFQFEDKIQESILKIESALTNTFYKFEKANNPSDLNKLRTAIRVEATDNIAQRLSGEQRVFTLTAPTGAGKTFTLLSVALEIQRKKGQLGIIYALPFLSITEQVQKILHDDLGIDYLPISSKSQNKEIETAQFNYELNPTKENLQKLLQQDFAEQTFDHPFIVTTFVQLFETLISNQNSTLLKLPNFSNRIFLIDEVQSLPPRLYIFFSAWIEAFCRKNNSYAVLSTATMPKLDFPIKETIADDLKPELLFKEYNSKLPVELTNPQRYFSVDIFSRYRINLIDNDKFIIKDLTEHILRQTQSCLIILNTIADTKLLFEALKSELNVILLNTHFIPTDRSKKIERAKTHLKANEKVILISTQLIEAGVDIDFPIVYRDLCPLPSLIQSAGRCNRNKTINMGQVYFFQLQKEHGKSSSEIIYKKDATDFLRFCRNEIIDGIEEKQLFDIQSRFFTFIKENLSIGEFEYGHEQKANMIECINKADFERLGRFQLINNDTFGEQYRYYIPKDNNDFVYEDLVEIMQQSLNSKTYEERVKYKIAINSGLKALSDRVLNVHINSNKNQNAPAFRNSEEYFGIRVLSDLSSYSSDTGLELGIENLIF